MENNTVISLAPSQKTTVMKKGKDTNKNKAICPLCSDRMETTIFYGVEVDYCPKCLGLWFDYDELRLAKDEKDKFLKWIDIDLWNKELEFKVSRGLKVCPKCAVPLYAAEYGDSKIIVDVCALCGGIWLDRGEFKKIIDYSRRKGNYETINNCFSALIEEGKEIFNGPEGFKSELEDFLVLLKLLKYKFLTRYSGLTKIISVLPH